MTQPAKVICYLDGFEPGHGTYTVGTDTLADIARLYVEEWHEDETSSAHNVIVVPLNDAARAIGGWHSDEDSRRFRLFVVQPTVTWEVHEVVTFSTEAP